MGISPIIMNKLDLGLLCKRQKHLVSDQKAAESKLYKNKKGVIGIPAHMFFACLCDAGRLVRNGKKKITTLERWISSSILPSLVSIKEDFILLNDGKGGKPRWVIDRRCWHSHIAKGHLVFPRFNSWGFRATLEVDKKKVKPEIIKQLVEIAGNKIGMCYLRPTHRGPFGRFEIAEWKVNGKN